MRWFLTCLLGLTGAVSAASQLRLMGALEVARTKPSLQVEALPGCTEGIVDFGLSAEMQYVKPNLALEYTFLGRIALNTQISYRVYDGSSVPGSYGTDGFFLQESASGDTIINLYWFEGVASMKAIDLEVAVPVRLIGGLHIIPRAGMSFVIESDIASTLNFLTPYNHIIPPPGFISASWSCGEVVDPQPGDKSIPLYKGPWVCSCGQGRDQVSSLIMLGLGLRYDFKVGERLDVFLGIDMRVGGLQSMSANTGVAFHLTDA